MQNKTAIDICEVSKVFYPLKAYMPIIGSRVKGFKSVDHVSFKIQEGEMVGLLGPNGAGKTTLLKIIATLILPSQGRVLYYDRDNRYRVSRETGFIGFVTCDERSFYWRLSGWQNLMFFAALYRIPKKTAVKRAHELLEALGLSRAATERFDKFSAGMKQKLSIARGLLSNPKIVLYDEPTRSLDPISQNNIHSWIQEKRKKSPNQSHLIATHNLAEAEALCDRVVILNNGKKVAEDTVDSLRRSFPGYSAETHCIHIEWRRKERKKFFENSLASTRGITFDIDETDTFVYSYYIVSVNKDYRLKELLDRIAVEGGRVIGVQSRQPSFDEIFCNLVKSEQDRNPK